MGVRVAAEPVRRLEEDDVMGAGQQVGSGQSGDPGADDGYRWAPCDAAVPGSPRGKLATVGLLAWESMNINFRLRFV